ncbi:PspC domain-containing protein [Rhodococcus hoagii]|nr:PspC domain-containing protein [Prescottella equi]
MVSRPAAHQTRCHDLQRIAPPFVRSSSQRMLSGVCGGIAEYFGIDVNLVRVAAVVGAFVSFGTVALIYLAAWMIMPSE